MPGEPVNPLGRREADGFGPLSPEVVHVLILQLQQSLDKLEASSERGFEKLEGSIERGFSAMGDRVGLVEKRVTSLEDFRTRSLERGEAEVRAEGQLNLSWQAVAALISVVSLVVGVIVALVTG